MQHHSKCPNTLGAVLTYECDFLGDKIVLEAKNDGFVFSVKDKHENEVMNGKASHGDKKEINFPKSERVL